MRVGILAIPGVQMLDVAGPMDVFFEAGNQVGDPSAYSVTVIALNQDSVTALNGLRFAPDASLELSLSGYDTLLVAGSPGIREYEQHARLLAP